MAHAVGSKDGSVSRAPAHFMGRALALAAVAGAVIALDQWTKSWALHNLSITSPRHVLALSTWCLASTGVPRSPSAAAPPGY